MTGLADRHFPRHRRNVDRTGLTDLDRTALRQRVARAVAPPDLDPARRAAGIDAGGVLDHNAAGARSDGDRTEAALALDIARRNADHDVGTFRHRDRDRLRPPPDDESARTVRHR